MDILEQTCHYILAKVLFDIRNMNRVYQHTYTTLTIDVIYEAYDQARSECIEPECLFVTQRGRRELKNLSHFYRENLNTTSNVITFLGMSVVVLPTLPENTLRIGPSSLEVGMQWR